VTNGSEVKTCTINGPDGPLTVGRGSPLVWIAGPCVLDKQDVVLSIAEKLKELSQKFSLLLIFKGSFDKANRSSLESYRGMGLDGGLKLLEKVRSEFSLPVTTDIHIPEQAAAVGEVCDLIQIPAFLVRQTDLLVAAAKTGKPVNAKKGQFMAPSDMTNVVEKLSGSQANGMMLTERGTFFGYGRLVNDMTGLIEMRKMAPVIFDATHSVQCPGGLGKTTGGNRQYVSPLAKAAVAVGIDGLFLETHPDPSQSPSDGPNMIPMDQLDSFIPTVLKVRQAVTCD